MNYNICSRCIYDTKTPGISFNADNVCNYCLQVDELASTYQTGTKDGENKLNSIIQEIKKSGKNKKYDCVIGLSGGTDSSYLLIQSLKWGLRPLAVHYDNTWNSSIASENIRKVTSKLNVDLYTYVVDNKEADDIFKSFLLAGVPEFDASTDIGFVQVLRSAAAKYRIKYILEGHSFMAEGVSPQGNNYFDGKYIKSVHKKYGKLKLKTYPNLTFFQFMKWILVYRQKFIRPLWYINYSKVNARKILEEKTGWSYYGGHHLENRSTSFLHTIYNPQKFGIDNRNWSLSAEARTGVLDRQEALRIYNTPIVPDPELVDYVKKRLSISDNEYEAILNGPKKSHKDFRTYKKRFERLRPLFYLLSKADLVPKSFYIKYCFPNLNE
jgi:N-acetyl sugar amidotransferase